jgi:thiamine biosynthesis lipoprotein
MIGKYSPYALQLRETFQAMGNTAVIDAGDIEAFVCARDRLWELERRWSRFDPCSDISRLNSAEGATVAISKDTALLLTYMKEARGVTNGLYDPTLLVAMLKNGYGQSLSGFGVTVLPKSILARGEISRIVVTENDGIWEASLPVGTAVDPGGMGKGLATDIVAEELTREYRGGIGVAVALGGDVRVIGVARSIGIEHPYTRETIEHVFCADGALATSGRWSKELVSGASHVVDPRTLAAPTHSIVQVTVAAGSCVWAEALATACLVSGSFEIVDGLGIGALAVRVDGSVTRSTYWKSGMHL